MTGMDATTGRQLSGFDHLRQSVRDILTTPIGSRVMRREYGSRLPELVDSPLNAEGRLDLYVATAEALDKWEPRLALERVTSRAGADGRVELTIFARYLPDGQEITLDGIEVG